MWATTVLLGLCACVSIVNSAGVYEHLYTSVTSFPCTRLANTTNLIGCTSSKNGDAGELWPIQSEADIDDFHNHKSRTAKIIVLSPSLLNAKIINKLYSESKIAGFIVSPTGNDTYPTSLSLEEEHPNKKYGLYPNSTVVWNPKGNTLSYDQIHIPVYYIPYTDYVTEGVLEKAKSNAHTDGYPKWGARLSSWMAASGPTSTCLRRTQCDPLGGKSTWSAIGGSIDQSKDIVLLVAHLDATALFHDKAIGADATVSGKVAAIVAAKALSQAYRSYGPFNKQVIVALFDGESWGYLGSKRFVRDIQSFNCKQRGATEDVCLDPYSISMAFKDIQFDKIDTIVEIGMVGNLQTTGGNTTLYAHTDNTKAPGSSALPAFFQAAGQSLNITVNDVASSHSAAELPPSSVMSFLLKKPIKSVVIAEHSGPYTNPYYGSHLDDFKNINSDHVTRVAQLIANTVLTLAGSSSSNVSIDANLTSQLIYCFSNSFHCDLTDRYLGGGLPVYPTQYTGVWNWGSVSAQSKLAHDVLFDVTKSNTTNTACSTASDCAVGADCIAGNCTYGWTHYHDALSIGLDFDYNGGGGYIENDEWDKNGATWTESRWDSTVLEIYQADSPSSELVVLSFGVVITLASMLTVWAIGRYYPFSRS
ncbi:hypothetical protein PROFUN_06724 [Planoprotostelium fungivorum]|uniref:Nicastrin n=1 Tax=Planoprotostelium fungivorum TaxID=1890364 RepID=A0A2P6NG55_9EUKA|nr:hypothetical protein PROFUN_06724 [Planoprotostelium fungivorum]